MRLNDASVHAIVFRGDGVDQGLQLHVDLANCLVSQVKDRVMTYSGERGGSQDTARPAEFQQHLRILHLVTVCARWHGVEDLLKRFVVLEQGNAPDPKDDMVSSFQSKNVPAITGPLTRPVGTCQWLLSLPEASPLGHLQTLPGCFVNTTESL